MTSSQPPVPHLIPPDDRFASQWRVFKSWHSEQSLWREIYARSASALIVAFVLYGVAALAGMAPKRPAIVAVCGILATTGLRMIVVSWRVAKRWKGIRPLFKSWDYSDDPEMAINRAIYVQFTWAMFSLRVGSIVVVVLLFGCESNLKAPGASTSPT